MRDLKIMCRTVLLTISVALAIAGIVVGCQSPLDASGPRIRTPLTPAPRYQLANVQLTFLANSREYDFVGTPVIEVDTTTTPFWRVWLNISLVERNASPTGVIKGCRVALDSQAVNGFDTRVVHDPLKNQQMQVLMTSLGNDLWFDCDGSANRATIAFEEVDAGQPPSKGVKITFFLEGNIDKLSAPDKGEEQVFGYLVATF
jgi:hypothetical protein